MGYEEDLPCHLCSTSLLHLGLVHREDMLAAGSSSSEDSRDSPLPWGLLGLSLIPLGLSSRPGDFGVSPQLWYPSELSACMNMMEITLDEKYICMGACTNTSLPSTPINSLLVLLTLVEYKNPNKQTNKQNSAP